MLVFGLRALKGTVERAVHGMLAITGPFAAIQLEAIASAIEKMALRPGLVLRLRWTYGQRRVEVPLPERSGPVDFQLLAWQPVVMFVLLF